MWVAAHGVMIVTPVNWYQAPSGLKAMIDRLVCADGGNPDPTSTGGKDPKKAKDIEMKGWDYPRHLAGRAFSVVVHGDAAGTETLRRILVDWLKDMGLVSAGHAAELDRYVGYYEPYATSHDGARPRPGLPGGDAQRRARAGAGGQADAPRRAGRSRMRGLREVRPK